MSRVALITGATSGIGRAVALGLKGYKMALVGRSVGRLEKVASRLNHARVYPTDVSDPRAVHDCVEAVLSDFGQVDLLFNCAGVLHRGTLEDLSQAQFEEMLEVNLRAPFLFMKGLLPGMAERGSGAVINVSSRSGKVGFPAAGGYAASKFGLNGLNEAAYRRYCEMGVSITSLCPSWVDTPMAENSGLPGEEMIPTADIVATVEWLLNLSPASRVKEVVIECRKSIY